MAPERNTDDYLQRWERYVDKWKHATVALAVLLLLSVGLSALFLEGGPWHPYWRFGHYLIWMCCILLTLLMGSMALTVNFSSYLRQLRLESRPPDTPRKTE